MGDCLFCKIIAGEIPSKKIYEDDKVLAFYDISPEAPVHFLVIPKEHISSANEINEKNADIVSHIFIAINKIVKELNITDSNCKSYAFSCIRCKRVKMATRLIEK